MKDHSENLNMYASHSKSEDSLDRQLELEIPQSGPTPAEIYREKIAEIEWFPERSPWVKNGFGPPSRKTGNKPN